MKIVCLLSGGIDSTTAVYDAVAYGHEVHALSIVYGQKAKEELKCAKRTAAKMCKSHQIIELPELAKIWDTPLINKDCDASENLRSGDSYYVVPIRNVVLLSIAHAYAQTIGAQAVLIGNQGGDVAGFPDCRVETINAFDDLMKVASEKGKTTVTFSPWQNSTKEQVIQRGVDLNVPYEDTYSCYEDSPACGVCESCVLRLEAFESVGMEDPIEYK